MPIKLFCLVLLLWYYGSNHLFLYGFYDVGEIYFTSGPDCFFQFSCIFELFTEPYIFFKIFPFLINIKWLHCKLSTLCVPHYILAQCVYSICIMHFHMFSVNTISLAKPEKAKMVEGMLIQMAQSGQIQNKVQI